MRRSLMWPQAGKEKRGGGNTEAQGKTLNKHHELAGDNRGRYINDNNCPKNNQITEVFPYTEYLVKKLYSTIIRTLMKTRQNLVDFSRQHELGLKDRADDNGVL